MERAVFMVRSGNEIYSKIFKENSFAGIGWFPKASLDLKLKENILLTYSQFYPEDGIRKKSQNVGQINRFINHIKIGDIILTPHSKGYLQWGIVSSDYFFDSTNLDIYALRKNVSWNDTLIHRYDLSEDLQKNLRSTLTCFAIKEKEEILRITTDNI